MTYLIAVDPGKGTGMAMWNTQADNTFVSFELFTREGVYGWLDAVLIPSDDVHVICERYIMTPGAKTSQPDALMLMGAVEAFAYRARLPLHWQLPEPAKKRAPNAVLRRLGWYQNTKDGHANDAARHLLEWLAHNDPERFVQMIGE
jgi:hypothetical protein